MSIKLGMNCKLYFNSGTWDTPAWEEVGNTKDVSLSLETDEADVTVRNNDGWEATVATLKKGTTEFKMIYDTEDDNFNTVHTAWFGSGSIEVAVMDGDITEAGTTGLHALMSVPGFSIDQSLKEAVTVDVTLKPTYSVNAPEWLEIST